MYTKLTEVKLKTGDIMEVGSVLAPDEEFADRIKSFLGHKGGVWNWHIERSFEEQLDELETRYYIGLLSDEIISNIMIVEHRHTGILGHVFTEPEHRRKGACTGVMDAQMEDFRRRDGEALYLGTGYDGPAYHIYASFGFESVYPRSGFMKYHAIPDFDAKYFAKRPAHVKDVEWQDWGKITALTGIVYGDYLRSIAFEMYGANNFEGTFLGFKKDQEENKRYHNAKLLETEDRAIVALATLISDSRFRGGVYILDVFAHPNFWDDVPSLISAMNLPQAKIQCYVDSTPTNKAKSLEVADFQQEAELKNQIRRGEDFLDVSIFART